MFCLTVHRLSRFLGFSAALLLLGMNFSGVCESAVLSTDTTVSTANQYSGNQTIEITNGAVVRFNAGQNYTGLTTVTDGRLILNREAGFVNCTNYVIEENGVLELASKSPWGTEDIVRTFTLNGGTMDFSGGGSFANVAKLVLNGGTVSSSASGDANWGSFLLKDTVTCTADSTISANVTIRTHYGNLDGAPIAWTVGENAALTVSGKVRFQETGADGPRDAPVILLKEGAGTLLFTNQAMQVKNGSEIRVNGGTLKFTNVNAFQHGENAIKLSVNSGNLLYEGAGGTIKNDIFVAEGQTAELKHSENLNYNGSLTGKGTVKQTSSEWKYLYLYGDNSAFEGTLTTNPGGVLFFGNGAASIPNASFVPSSTICFLPASANDVFSFGSLTGGGQLRPSTSSAHNIKIQVGGLNKNETFTGRISDFDDGTSANYAKSVAVEKVGTGTLTLTGNNRFRGGLTVSNGTLKTWNPASLGTSSILVSAASADEFGTLELSGKGTYTNDVHLEEGAVLKLTTTTDGHLYYSGSLSGSGDVQTFAQFVANADRFVRLTGDNSAFSGTLTHSGTKHLFFEQGASASKNASYILNSHMVVRPVAANTVYEFGSLNMKSNDVRHSNETANEFRNSIFRIGNLNKDDTITAKITSNIGIEKVGTGTLTMNRYDSTGANDSSYEGGVTVKNGTLKFNHPSVLGSTGKTVNVTADAAASEAGTLLYAGGSVDMNHSVSVAEGAVFAMNAPSSTLRVIGNVTGTGTLDVQAGTLSIANHAGRTTIPADVNVAVGATFKAESLINLSGNLTGQGTVHFTNSSEYDNHLAGDNSAFEGTFIANGLTFLTNPQSTSAKAAYVANERLILKRDGGTSNTYELGSLTGSSIVRPSNVSAAGVTYLKVGALGRDETFSGMIGDYEVQTLGLIKTGTGTLTLTHDHSKNIENSNPNLHAYTRGTTVEGGTLKIANGALIGSSVNDLVLVKAESVSANDTPGIILNGTINGRLEVNGDFILDFMDSNTNIGIVTGEVLFGDSAELQILMGSTGADELSYTLLTENEAYAQEKLTELYLAAVEAGTMPNAFSISSIEGGVLLSTTAPIPGSGVPEPASVVLLGLGVGILAFLNRRRAKAQSA